MLQFVFSCYVAWVWIQDINSVGGIENGKLLLSSNVKLLLSRTTDRLASCVGC